MFPSIQQSSSKNPEKHLRALFRQLDPQDQATLMRFAEFLVASAQVQLKAPKELPLPESIERPAEESVVKAIKRLTATYSMLNPDRLLSETSSLMTAHVMHGKAAAVIIDELEALFLRHYQSFKTEFEQNQ